MKLKHSDRANLITTPQLHIATEVIREFDNKLWVKVWPRYNHCSKCGQWGGFKPWVVSFQDLYYIVKEIGDCENIKYPPREGYRGRQMVANFLWDCLTTNMTFEELQVKYQIPDQEARK